MKPWMNDQGVAFDLFKITDFKWEEKYRKIPDKNEVKAFECIFLNGS